MRRADRCPWGFIFDARYARLRPRQLPVSRHSHREGLSVLDLPKKRLASDCRCVSVEEEAVKIRKSKGFCFSGETSSGILKIIGYVGIRQNIAIHKTNLPAAACDFIYLELFFSFAKLLKMTLNDWEITPDINEAPSENDVTRMVMQIAFNSTHKSQVCTAMRST